MSNHQLPDSDNDLMLARHIGSSLAEQRDLSNISDPLLDSLLSYKAERENTGVSESLDSQDMWNRIVSETKPDGSNIYTLFGKNKSVWAAAAGILISALIGVFYYTSQPQLIAESGREIATVALENGSTATLRPHSEIHLLSKNSKEIAYRLQGEAFFEVEKGDTRIFSVEAGSGEVRVLGTRFNLSSWGGQTQVYLEEGLIAFRHISADQTVKLEPGQSAQIKSDTNLIPRDTADVNPSEFTDWMNRELIFRNRTAGYVFSEFEQEFGIIIEASESVKSTSLSGGLALDDLEQSLQDLALVLNGEFTKVNQNTYKFESNR